MKRNGFTLVEVIVVVCVMAILMAVSVPVATSYFQDANENKVMNEAKTVLEVAKSHLSLKASLSGTFIEDRVLSEEQKQEITEKAYVEGDLKNLEYTNSKISSFKYCYLNLCVISTDGQNLELDK